MPASADGAVPAALPCPRQLQGARPNDHDRCGKDHLREPIPAEEIEPTVLGESSYDKVTSFLMAVVLGAMLVVGWLALVYVSNQAYASRVTAPLADHRGRRRGRQSRRDGRLDGESRRRGGRRGRDGLEQPGRGGRL